MFETHLLLARPSGGVGWKKVQWKPLWLYTINSSFRLISFETNTLLAQGRGVLGKEGAMETIMALHY